MGSRNEIVSFCKPFNFLFGLESVISSFLHPFLVVFGARWKEVRRRGPSFFLVQATLVGRCLKESYLPVLARSRSFSIDFSCIIVKYLQLFEPRGRQEHDGGSSMSLCSQLPTKLYAHMRFELQRNQLSRKPKKMSPVWSSKWVRDATWMTREPLVVNRPTKTIWTVGISLPTSEKSLFGDEPKDCSSRRTMDSDKCLRTSLVTFLKSSCTVGSILVGVFHLNHLVPGFVKRWRSHPGKWGATPKVGHFENDDDLRAKSANSNKRYPIFSIDTIGFWSTKDDKCEASLVMMG